MYLCIVMWGSTIIPKHANTLLSKLLLLKNRDGNAFILYFALSILGSCP